MSTNSLGYSVKPGSFSSGKFEGKINDVDINDMSDDVKDLKTNVASIQTDLADVTELKTDVASLQTDVTDLKSATLTVTLTSGTTYTFPETVVQGQQIVLVNAQAATSVTVATTYTDATSSMVLTPGDKLLARGGTVSDGAKWLIGI
jgi:nitrogen fixation protein FixH